MDKVVNEIKVTCKDCGAQFVVSAGEQEWLAEKGFKLPKRCPECRRRRKEQRV